MKKIIGLLSIFIVLVLGAYYGMGIATERVVRHQLQRINSSNGLHVKIINYSRHWFRSTAEFEWKLNVPEHTSKSADEQVKVIPAETYTIQTPLTIYHGPVIFANNTVKFGLGYAYSNIDMPSKFDQQFKDNFTNDSVKPTLNISLFVTYLNHSKFDFKIPSFNLIAKQGGRFDWLGLKNHVDISYNASKIKGYLSSKGFKFSKDETKSNLDKITSNYKLHKLENGLFLGKADFNLSLFGVYQKDTPIFEVTKFAALSDSNVKDNLVYSNFNASLDKVLVNGVTYGPGTLDMSIKNLDSNVLAEMNSQISQAQQGTDLEKQQAMLEIMPKVPRLLSRGAEFEISKLELTMPQGIVKGNLLITLPNGQAGHPLQLIQKIHGQAQLTMPIEVVKMALMQMNRKHLASTELNASSATNSNPALPQNSTEELPTKENNLTSADARETKVVEMTSSQLNNMVKTGLLVINNTNYQIEATLNNGRLLINNHPFNPQMLQF